MLRSCPLAGLPSVLAQSGRKSTQSRTTEFDVAVGDKPRCGCVKQQNDTFVLQSQRYLPGNAAYSVGFVCNSSAAIPIVCTLKLCSALAAFSTPVVACKKPSRLRFADTQLPAITTPISAMLGRNVCAARQETLLNSRFAKRISTTAGFADTTSRNTSGCNRSASLCLCGLHWLAVEGPANCVIHCGISTSVFEPINSKA